LQIGGGGAVLPVVMGRISDLSSIATAVLVSGACFIVIGAFALSGRNTSPAFGTLAEP
jgi:FHS family L-fucose permease-like MFS transporter